jgi:hypothetical protein
MMGGIVARLALESVPDVVVLDGPSLCDEIVAQHGGNYYVDDGISKKNLDVVCGVYHVFETPGGGNVAHASYWPKHLVWKSSGVCGDQWSPLAESEYQDRVVALEQGNLKRYNSKTWRGNLRYTGKKTEVWIRGSERLTPRVK